MMRSGVGAIASALLSNGLNSRRIHGTEHTIKRARIGCISVAVAFSFSGLSAHGAGVTFDGVSGGDWNTAANWSSGAYPTTADYAVLDATASLETTVSNNIQAVRIGTSGTGVLHITPAGTLNASQHASWDSHIGSGSGNSGTLNQYGGSATFNELEIGRDSSTGLYNLYAGQLTIARVLKDYSIYLGTDDAKGTTGTGTLYISGGSILTRAGVYLGSPSGGTGIFHVEGAGASEINIGSNNSIDGAWTQNAGSTLQIRIDKSSTGVTPIFIDYVDGTGLGGSVMFEDGALLDVGFSEGFVNGGTYTVMQWEGNVTNNGLQFASTVDTNIWSFDIDEANKQLTVTAAGEPYVRTFVHPGLSHKLSDLQRMRDMVAAGVEPWASTYEALSSLPRASYDVSVGATSATNGNITTLTSTWNKFMINDGTTAYYNALMWMMTGDSRYADKAVEVFNAWSYLTRNEQSMALNAGRHWRIIEAAEIIQSTYDGWAAADLQRFKDMLVYPGFSGTTVPQAAIDSGDVTLYWRVYNGDPARHGNQGLFGYRVMLAMAVFLDNEVMYDRAIRMLKGLPHGTNDVAFASGPPITTGPESTSNAYYEEYSRTGQDDTVEDYGYNEVMWNYIWENGQGQESSRDQAHGLAGASTIATMCEIFWNQGDDLYSYLDNRVLLGLEFYYHYNLSLSNSYPDQVTSWEPTAENGEFIQRLDRSGRWKSLQINPYLASNIGDEYLERGKHNLQPVYEMNLAHYRDRMNVSSNDYTWLERGFDLLVEEQGIELEGTVTDHPGYGGLKFRRVSPGDPISGFDGAAPIFEMNELPATVEAENYDYFPISGQNRTYYDVTDHNSGGEYRVVDSVDISTCSEGGYALSSIEDGEWVTYTVAVPATSAYDISIRYASSVSGGKIAFSFDGSDKTGAISIPNSSGAWQDLTLASNVNLDQSVQQLKISFSGTSDAFLLNSFTITKSPVYPVGHWTFDDASGTVAADSSGNGYDATVVNAVWTDGMNDSALDFDGSSAQVVIPGSVFSSISNQVSISLWTYGATDLTNNSVFYAVNSSNGRILNVHLPYTSTVYWDAGDSGYDRISQVATTDELTGSWCHWVFTKDADSGTMKIYRNGTLWLSGTGKTKTITGIASATIGSQVSSAYYSGTIDDVRIYDVALSDDEVQALYDSSLVIGQFASFQDIGTPSLAGSATYSNGIYTVTGGGNDFYNTADNGYFISSDQSGDGALAAEVLSVENTDSWAKAGVMFRETTDAGSKEVLVAVRPDNQVTMQYRDSTDGSSTSLGLFGDTSNVKWVKLERSGDLFTGYYSIDGLTWTPIDSVTISMNTDIQAGLAVSAHDDTQRCTATFNLELPSNIAPVAENISISVDEDSSTAVTLSGSDADGDTLTYSLTSQPANGSLSGSAPNLTYIPDVDFNGADSFSYTVNDGTVESSAATVTITVNTINDAPVFSEATLTDSANEEIAYTGSVAGSATDVDGDALTYSKVSGPAWLQVATDGSLSGTPQATNIGLNTFSIQAEDGSVSTTASLEITVILADGLIAQWALDDATGTTVSDETGHGYDGVNTGASWISGINGGALEFDGTASTVSLPATAFSAVSNEITVAMWTYGGDLQPQDNSIFYAVDDSNNRVLNVHLPWSNGTVYWDAGFSGSYDRINKSAATAEYKGQWNHWVFTKNATTGEMAIYLNGALWLSATGKTRTISGITAAALGSQISGVHYEGNIDDVRLYNVSLDASEVSDLYLSYTVTNGVPVGWLVSNGIDPTDAGALADSDGDGLANWEEYATGNDPMVADNPPGIRVTEYYLTTGDFSGTEASVTLNQELADDYFILIRGSHDGNSLSMPNNDYARVSAVPNGTGDLIDSGSTTLITLSRAVADLDWEGVMTVVECTNPSSTSGFKLVDILSTDLSGTTGTDTAASWSDVNQVVLFGGYRGGGAAFVGTPTSRNHGTSLYTRLYPSGSNTLNWSRNAGGETLFDAVMTTFVVEWGANWNVQHVNISGSAGGDAADVTGEYTTAAISAVVRDNTWVWGTGTRADAGIGDSAEACLITLGDGVNQNATESSVAIGSEYTDAYDFDVYTMTHSGLAVDYRFKPDGDSASSDLAVTVDTATSGTRMGWSYNGCNGTGTYFPRPRMWARYTADGEITLSRGFSGQNFPAWLQGIDFSGINQ